MRSNQKDRCGGFTLIEVIITLVVVAVFGAMLVTYFEESFTNSLSPVSSINSALSLEQVMENITADYKNNYSSNLAGLQTSIGGEATDQNNNYGQYTVLYNRFISFDSNRNELSGGANLLKVTIKDSLGETLTALFSQ